MVAVRHHRFPGDTPGDAQVLGRALRQAMHHLLLPLLGLAHTDAQHRNPTVGAHQPHHQPGLRTRTSGGMHKVIDPETHVVGLPQHLQRAAHVAQGPHRIGAAPRDHVGPAPLPLQLPAQRLCRRVHVLPPFHKAHLRSEQMVQEDVAGGLVVRGHIRHTALQEHHAIQSQPGGGRSGLPDMVGLHCALGDHAVGPLLQRFAHEEVQLAGLVPAGGQPRTVVALDPERGSPQGRGEAGHGLQRRGDVAEPGAGKPGQVHGRIRLRSGRGRAAPAAGGGARSCGRQAPCAHSEPAGDRTQDLRIRSPMVLAAFPGGQSDYNPHGGQTTKGFVVPICRRQGPPEPGARAGAPP